MPENYSILSQRELRRYSKQIMIPEFGTSGQEKLKKASVLVVGAGGIGSPVLQYLAAAGIGKIGIAESDMVSEGNLQRQVLYGSEDVGKLKSVIAKKRLEQMNSFVTVEILNLRVDAGNVLELFRNYDIITDATDNLAARYVINDACVILDKPMVHGSIYKFEGMVSVFNYRGGPTYRCFNPYLETNDSRNPSPSQTGILNFLPGITGTMMAGEVIKILTGTGNVLSGKVLLYNIAKNSYRFITVKEIPGNRSITMISSAELK